MGLVAQERRAHALVVLRDDLARHVDDPRFITEGATREGEDLIPREPFVARDVDGPGNRLRVAEKAHEAHGEIPVVRDRPKARAVAVDDDLLARLHAGDMGVTAFENDAGLVVGVRGTDDRVGELLLCPGGLKEFLAGDLVARILPVRIAERRLLGDGHRGGRRLVGRGGADENELPHPPAEKVEADGEVFRNEADPVHDRIELHAPEGGLRLGGIADVGVNLPHARAFARRDRRTGPAAVQVPEFDAALERQSRARGTDDAGAADEKDLLHAGWGVSGLMGLIAGKAELSNG